uniref:Glycosyltransferase family 92 protein n=1 Tax=Panagrellus redivivus TaxID=6233 RepID=A0A7E4ZUU6_PANRE
MTESSGSAKKLFPWKRISGLITYFLSFTFSNKHATRPRLDNAFIDDENLYILPSNCLDVYDQVFITDNDEIYQWASKDTYMFKLFKFIYKLRFLNFFLNGIVTVNPCWHSVLWVDEVVYKNVPIEITDTLILHCKSIDTYSKVIPRIRESYNRLVLHGHTSWQQIQQLYHPGVKQIRINATFEITKTEYDEFVNFVIKHCRGINYK